MTIDYPSPVQRLEAEVARLRAALEKYGDHLLGCEKVTHRALGYDMVSDKCTCGFDAAMVTGAEGR